MNLYIDNHSFHYEMENLTRAFLFFEDVRVIHEYDEPAEPYILTSVGDRITVTLCAEGFCQTLSCDLGGDDELHMAALLYRLLRAYTGRELPWGVLTGVRPIKLYAKLCEEMGESGAREYFRDQLLVSDEKIALASGVSSAQRDIISASDKRSFSLYISIPFCPTRCSYCSFVSQSIERAKGLVSDYIPLLLEEIDATAALSRELGLTLKSVYIGGGTPTTLSAEQLRILIGRIRDDFDMTECMEFTVEAGRPDTVTLEKLLALKDGGVTRISINPQTFSDTVLETIGRRHTSQQTLDAFALAREVGMDNINMDFIAGLQGDTPESFRHSIDTACELGAESITVHTLAIKRSARMRESDAMTQFGDTEQMLAYASKKLTEEGYVPYYLYRQSKMLSNLENIGWAKPGYFSPYNIFIMEETHSILACGAGGVTKLRDTASNYIERIFNFKFPYEYISRFDEMITRKEGVRRFYSEYNK